MAREILVHWGIPAAELKRTDSGEAVLGARPHGLEVLALVKQRQTILKDAWLTATGHRRPGMARGLQLPEAERLAREIQDRIARLVSAAPDR